MTERAGAGGLADSAGQVANPASAAVPLVLHLDGKIPSKKNSYRIGNRRFFKDAKTAAWEKSAAVQLIAQRDKWAGRGCPLQATTRVALRFTYGDRRRHDTINTAETVLDMLTEVGILADDNWQVIPSLELSGAYHKKQDGCVVGIWPAERREGL